jgi:hypothetical protein
VFRGKFLDELEDAGRSCFGIRPRSESQVTSVFGVLDGPHDSSVKGYLDGIISEMQAACILVESFVSNTVGIQYPLIDLINGQTPGKSFMPNLELLR